MLIIEFSGSFRFRCQSNSSSDLVFISLACVRQGLRGLDIGDFSRVIIRSTFVL